MSRSQRDHTERVDRNNRNDRTGHEDPQLYALVRWTSGPHEGTMSHNIRVEWIKGFDPLVQPFDDSYVIEWRTQPKPRAGWHLYDGEVLDVSDDVDSLAEQMRQLEMQDGDQDSRVGQTTPHNVLNSPEFRSLLSGVVSNALSRSARSHQTDDASLNSHSSNSEENMHRVGKKLLLTHTAYLLAKASPSGPSMTMGLVRATYSKRRLRKSSYAGQKRKDVQKPGLKRFIRMQDIQDFVRSRFPFMSQSSFSQAVNACTGKNVDKVKARELCDESDSSSDDDGDHSS